MLFLLSMFSWLLGYILISVFSFLDTLLNLFWMIGKLSQQYQYRKRKANKKIRIITEEYCYLHV